MGACQSRGGYLSKKASKLAENGILVKKLEAIEDLDLTTCICANYSELCNSTQLSHVWYDGKLVKATNIQKVTSDKPIEYDVNNATFKVLMEDGCLATEAIFDNSIPIDTIDMLRMKYKDEAAFQSNYKKESEKLESKPWDERPVIGDAMETVLIKFIQPIVDIMKTRSAFPVVRNEDGSYGIIPYNNALKYNLSICSSPQKEFNHAIIVKGQVNKILSMCDSLLLGGKAETLDAEWKRRLNETVENLQSRGEVVIAFARKYLPAEKYSQNYQYNVRNPLETNYPVTEYTLSGLFTIKKSPPSNLKDQISKCIAGGIKVVLFGSENPLFASAAAHDLGIFDPSIKVMHQTKSDSTETAEAMLISGDALKTESLSKWISASRLVFAGLQYGDDVKELVYQLRKQGQIVTLIDSDSRDISAMKEANVTVVNGIICSDIVKDVSQMVRLRNDASVELLKEILKTKQKRTQSKKDKNRV